MNRSSKATPFDVRRRGYAAIYRLNERNSCPGCGGSQWLVGRLLAECGFCATALPLHDGSRRGDLAVHTGRSGPVSLERGRRAA